MLFADDTNLFSNGFDATGHQDDVNYDLALIRKVCIIHLYIFIWYIATKFGDLPVKHTLSPCLF